VSFFRRIPLSPSQSIVSFLSGRIQTKFGGRVVFIPKPSQTKRTELPNAVSDPTTGWNLNSKRTGVIAVKMGMIHDWNNYGVMIPMTVLQIQDCQVIGVRTVETHGYTALQLGAINTKLRRVSRAMMGQFAKADVPPKKYLCEFHVTPEAILPIGSSLYARHFLPGQLVDVKGVSKGKGFQGPMKRHGFRGQPATHGASLSHRSHGATGARQDPGKVWKGKRMAGHMGSNVTFIYNLQVVEIYPEYNLLCVHGAVPGAPGTVIEVRDALANIFRNPPPFPTYIPKADEVQPEVLRLRYRNPWPVPNLEDYFWEHIKWEHGPERLVNNVWHPVFSAKLPMAVVEIILRRQEEIRLQKEQQKLLESRHRK